MVVAQAQAGMWHKGPRRHHHGKGKNTAGVHVPCPACPSGRRQQEQMRLSSCSSRRMHGQAWHGLAVCLRSPPHAWHTLTTHHPRPATMPCSQGEKMPLRISSIIPLQMSLRGRIIHKQGQAEGGGKPTVHALFFFHHPYCWVGWGRLGRCQGVYKVKVTGRDTGRRTGRQRQGKGDSWAHWAGRGQGTPCHAGARRLGLVRTTHHHPTPPPVPPSVHLHPPNDHCWGHGVGKLGARLGWGWGGKSGLKMQVCRRGYSRAMSCAAVCVLFFLPPRWYRWIW